MMMKVEIEKQKEIFLPKFDFGYPKPSKHEIIGKFDPAILDRVEQEEKILNLYAPSISILVNLIIPQREYDGWRADIAGSKLLYNWQDDEQGESDHKKMKSKVYQVIFRKITVKFNTRNHGF